MLSKPQQNSGFRLAIIAAIAFLIFALVLTLHRHLTFYSSYDQGIFNQVFWNGIHGRFFQSSLSSQLSTNVVHSGEVPSVRYHRLGQHFTPALLLWLPLYSLFPHPVTLTILQVILVTAAGLVLYVLARQYLEPQIAGMITVSFYGANAVLGPTLANFHDSCQTPLLVFSILLAMEKRWWWLFGLLAIFLLGVREDSGIILFGIGAYLIASRRYPRLGLAVCLVSFAYILVLTNLIMPLFSEDISKRFMLERFGQYVEGDEASTVEVLGGMLSQPWLLLVELGTPGGETVRYLLGHWLPLAFVPAIAPAAWMVAGFPLLKLLLGQGMSVLSITVRYALTVVPGLFYGTILWWAGQGWHYFIQTKPKAHPRKLTPLFRRFWIFCLTLSLLLTVASNPNRTLYFIIPDSVQPWVYVPLAQQWQRADQIRSLLSQIPADASVSATTYLIPHLSGRREVIRMPALQLRNDEEQVIDVEWAIADLWQLRRYQEAFKRDRQSLLEIVNLIERVTDTKKYGIIGFNNGVILLQKGASSQPEALTAWLAFRQELSEEIGEKGKG
ncbi:MAG: DUF2079 domain-containing protein [Cyanophyceae cyanobacterium]